ncbi:hypothetical protein A5662_10605 [Mycobacteriaceae bacterium 1482268.1]|nr:hypothetical protein A5662_10605 [Mycobacteriaceae bacterium 1482268.1]
MSARTVVRRGEHAPQQPVAPLASRVQFAGGISTVSIMYTCAFAVSTPPQTTPAFTVESRGGSEQPTTRPFAQLPLA